MSHKYRIYMWDQMLYIYTGSFPRATSLLQTAGFATSQWSKTLSIHRFNALQCIIYFIYACLNYNRVAYLADQARYSSKFRPSTRLCRVYTTFPASPLTIPAVWHARHHAECVRAHACSHHSPARDYAKTCQLIRRKRECLHCHGIGRACNGAGHATRT